MKPGEKSGPVLSSPPSPSAQRHRRWIYLIAGLFCIFLFLVATLPASWIDILMQRMAPGRLRIQETTGTIWNGSGNLSVHSLGQELWRTRIAWSVQPFWLVTGKLQIAISGQDPLTPLQARVRIGYRYLLLQQVDSTLPARIAAAFVPAATLLSPTGRVQIVADDTTLTPAGMQGLLQLNWLGAGAGMSGLDALGDYRLIVTGHGADADLRIETLRGDVGITAQGQWQTQGEGQLRLAGDVVPGGRELSLRPLLTLANIQNNNGQYRWAVNDRFPLARVFGSKP